MLAEQFKIGNASVTIMDDCIKSREESEELLKQAAACLLRQLNAERSCEKQGILRDNCGMAYRRQDRDNEQERK
jgi:hypothetical protein